LITAFLAAIHVFFRSRVDTSLDVLALRQQVAVLKRKAATTFSEPEVIHFFSVVPPTATEPNRLTYIAFIGAIVLAVALVALGVGLLRTSAR